MEKEYNKKNNISYINKTRTVVDAETGEVSYETDVYKRVYGQKQFYKLYLFDLLNALGMFSTSKQLDVFLHILEEMSSSTNLFIGTYDDIAENTQTSKATVQRAISGLLETNLIKRVQQGVYQVNPNVLVKGGVAKQAKLTMEYEILESEKEKETSCEEEVSEIPDQLSL